MVDGNYDSAFDLSIRRGTIWLYCVTQATMLLPRKKPPLSKFRTNYFKQNGTSALLNVFVSVGDGNIISGIHKGFIDLKELGWLPQMPRIFGVPSEKSSAVYQAWAKGSEEIIPVHATTFADSISVDLPRDGVRAVRAASKTGGAYCCFGWYLSRNFGNSGKSVFRRTGGATAYVGMEKQLKKG